MTGVPQIQSPSTQDISTMTAPTEKSSENVAQRLLATEPALVWKQFLKLMEIPRESKKEEGARAYLREFARERSLEIREDRSGNIVIRVPGRGKGTSAPTVILQSHVDMVCIKSEGAAHDFEKDAIQGEIREEEIRGELVEVLGTRNRETTLGADNGIGVAVALSMADDSALVDCPPLELLFTVDEETGLTGAKELEVEALELRGSYMINLDTEEENEIYISSAGSRDIVGQWNLARIPAPEGYLPVKISFAEFPGGHSGVEINDKRGNAIKALMETLLLSAITEKPLYLASFEGGQRRNSIPNSAEAVVWVDQKERRTLALAVQKNLAQLGGGELFAWDGPFEISIKHLKLSEASLPTQNGIDILRGIRKVRSGVLKMSGKVEGLVETSNNVAVVRTDGDVLSLACMTRSSAPGAVEEFQSEAAGIMAASGGEVSIANVSPGWEADMENPLLLIAKKVFTEAYNEPPQVKAVHAGLECGAIKMKKPDLKIISVGPDILNAHTPREFVGMRSVARFGSAMRALLSRACELPAVV